MKDQNNSLTIFTKAAAMLAEANTIQATKELKDLALTAQDFARRKGMGEEAIAHCRSYALDAERKMGEMLLATERAKGAKGNPKGRGAGIVQSPGVTAQPTLSELGVSKRESAEAQALAVLPVTVYEAVRAGKKTRTQVKRERREVRRASKREANRRKVSAAPSLDEVSEVFSTVLIDPPWDWGDEGDCDQMGRARPDYATMSLNELLKLPVAKLCAPDAHLYLWITNRSLPKGFALLEQWGFRYVTALTWPKPSFGMGNYFRGQTEHILFGVRGSLPLKRKNKSTLLPTWKRGKGGHSSKPAEIYEFVEACSPGPYLEMFSRGERKEWRTWGE